MRDVFQTLERLDIRYFVTGSEALGRYAQPRQTMDVDLVCELDAAGFDRLIEPLAPVWLVAEPLDFDGHLMASLVHRTDLAKVDLILLGPDDPWGAEAMGRRERWEHPVHGPIWVISLEDLLLAKLAWSEGTSELQLRDSRSLVDLNVDRIDWGYIGRHAGALGVTALVGAVRGTT